MSDDSGPRSAWEVQISGRIDSLEASRRAGKWLAGLAIPALFAAFAWSWTSVQVASERAGETRAEIAALHSVISILDSDVRELRAKILKLTDGTPPPGDVSIARR